jgi:viologen exporter family transport system permease protein
MRETAGQLDSDGPSYARVFMTFARNSLVRDMTFRANFLLDAVTSLGWMSIQLAYYLLIYHYTTQIGGWGRYQFFAFIATTLFVNSIVQAFFMPNAEEFSELIRTGHLDFALLKPIDTQFLISLRKIEWSSLSNSAFACVLLGYSLWQLDYRPGPVQVVLYPLYVGCGVAILYSLMIVMASISVWLGRNQSLYDFWFYITNFSRYPMEIYQGSVGTPLRLTFTFLIPILIVVNVPARLLAQPLESQNWPLAGFALLATLGSLWLSRRIFQRALTSYRSASS